MLFFEKRKEKQKQNYDMFQVTNYKPMLEAQLF